MYRIAVYAQPSTRRIGPGSEPSIAILSPVDSDDDWSVDRHLARVPEHVVKLYERVVDSIAACGPFSYSVTKTAIAFKGSTRGFAGAKPRGSSLDGFQRQVVDERFRRVSPYTKKLFVHQFRLTSSEQIDKSFRGLGAEGL